MIPLSRLSARLAALAAGVLAPGLLAASPVPIDNPVATHAGVAGGYPAWTDRIAWHRVIDMSAYGTPGQDAFTKFEAARDALAAAGGGVLYYPAGTYDFSSAPMDGPSGRGLMLRPGVVIRGEAPDGDRDASDGTLDLPTRFHFGFRTVTGTGVTPTGEVPRDWAFVGLDPGPGGKVEDVDQVGIAWVHLEGGTIFWGFGLDWPAGVTWSQSTGWKAALVKPAWANRVADGTHPWDYFAGSAFARAYVGAGRGRLVFGCVIRDGGPTNSMVMEGRTGGKNFGPDGFSTSKFGARIQVYGSSVAVMNNLLARSTRGFLYTQTVGDNPQQSTNASTWTNVTRTVHFNPDYVTGIDINKEYLNPFANKNAGYFEDDVVVAGNWVYNHGRKGFNVSGRHVVIRDNTNARSYLGNTVPAGSGPASGSSHYPTIDGYVQLKPGGDGSISDSLSRAFDLGGGPLWAHGNRYGGPLGSTQSDGNDGEGILCQAHGGTEVFSWAVTRNTGLDGYMAGYDVQQYGALWGWNTTVGTTGSLKAGSLHDTSIIGNSGGSTGITGSITPYTAPTGTPTAPPAPEAAVTADGDAILVSWQDGGPHEAGYRIERSIAGGPWQVISYRPRLEQRHASNPSAWRDGLAPRGKPLRYRVVALDASDSASSPASAASTVVTLPTLGPVLVPVSPSSLTVASRRGWEEGYRARVDNMLARQRWTNSSGAGDPDSGKRDWPALLAELWKVRDNDAAFMALVNGGNVSGVNGGNTLLRSAYAGTFYKPFTVPGYNFYTFLLKDGLRPGIVLPEAQLAEARSINWSFLTREDNRMDPIYGQTEFNSENFNWMARLGGLQWAFELPDTDLGTYQYNLQAGQPKGMSRAYFRRYMDNWTRALLNAGRVEWNSHIYWGYTFQPTMTLHEFPPVDPADPGYAARVRDQVRAGMDWMLLESALHHVDGFAGGPDARAKGTPHAPFSGTIWPYAYAYFADGPDHPGYTAAMARNEKTVNTVGWLPWSSWRPLRVVTDIANRRYPLPVEIVSAKPFYHLDHDNYAPWRGDGSFAAWHADKEAETAAGRTGFRFEFETIWQDRNVLLASLATWRPNGNPGTFSEHNLFRLLARGPAGSGAIQVAGNTGRYSNPAGRDPYEQIAQWAEVMLRVIKSPVSSQNNLWFHVPASATRFAEGDRVFADLGHGVFMALVPSAGSTTSGADRTVDGASFRELRWSWPTDQLGAVALEVGTTRTFADFDAFRASFTSRAITAPAADQVAFASARGRELRVRWTGVQTYPMTENGGYTLSLAGKVPEVWKDGTREDFDAWPVYGVREGPPIVDQPWGSGRLRMSAGGETVEITADPDTAAVTYARVEGIDPVGSPAGPFAAWSEARFTPQEIAAGLAAPDADPDGDGWANLVEHAFGTAPAGATPDPASQLAVFSEPVTGGETLVLRFPEVVPGLVRRVAWTDSLGQWVPVPILGTLPSNTTVQRSGGVTEVRVTLPVAPGRRFVRLELEPLPALQ